MRSFRKTRQSDRRHSTSRRNFLRVERLEVRWALATASPVAVNDFYHDLVNQPLDISAPGVLANDTSASGRGAVGRAVQRPRARHGRSVGRRLVSLCARGRLSGPRQLSVFCQRRRQRQHAGGRDDRRWRRRSAARGRDDSYSVDEDGTLDVASSDGVLANDTAADGRSLAACRADRPDQRHADARRGWLADVCAQCQFQRHRFVHVSRPPTRRAIAPSPRRRSPSIPVNDKPTAANDAFATSEDTSLTSMRPAGCWPTIRHRWRHVDPDGHLPAAAWHGDVNRRRLVQLHARGQLQRAGRL